jgi:transposase InsO family protein
VKQYDPLISRRTVDAFLKVQEGYQLHRRVIKPSAVKPFLVSGKRQLWCVDLVNLPSLGVWNTGYSNILVIIDVFTRFAWCVPLKTKTVAECTEAMRLILESVKEKPKRINTDNGGEFGREFTEMLTKYGITHSKTRSHSPQQNSPVESFNRTLKSLLFSCMTRHNTKAWKNLLAGVVSSYNSSTHSRSGYSPKLAETGMYDQEIYARMKANAMKVRQRQPSLPDLAVGSPVRILISAMGAKNVFEKSYTTKWTKEIYPVVAIKGSTFRVGTFERPFRRYELQLVTEVTRAPQILSRKEQQLDDLHSGKLRIEKSAPLTTVREDGIAERAMNDDVLKLKFKLDYVIKNYATMSKVNLLAELESAFPRANLGALSIHKLRALIAEQIIPALNRGEIPNPK